MITRRRFTLSILGLPQGFLFVSDDALGSEQALGVLDPNGVLDRYPDLVVTFCALDLKRNFFSVLNAVDIDARHTPWSTFKIPNLVIALETGVARNLDHRRRWDWLRRPAADHWPRDWRQDQSLATAFKRSVVWYFQDIAMEVGTKRYRADLVKFGYGNARVPKRGDDFWLKGSLKISPREQTEFLKRLFDGSLDISVATKEALREVSLVKVFADHALHGKTGAGPLMSDRFDGPFEGWFVGWVEQDDMPKATFALHVKGPDHRSIRTARQAIAERLLKAAGHLPTDWS